MGGFDPQNLEITHILVVKDVEASKRWYLEVLGASLYRQYAGSSVVLRMFGNWVLLVTPGGPTEDKPTIAFATPQDPDVVSHAFTIRVPDCSSAYEELRARGASFLTPPYDWGQEVRCFFRDPDGHLFEISEYVGA